LPTWLSEGTASYEARMMNKASNYIWSYTIVDFAMTEYGRDTLRPWIDNGGNFDSTFGVSEAAFRMRWIEYLKAHYSTPGDTL
jgi:hypothetical protein